MNYFEIIAIVIFVIFMPIKFISDYYTPVASWIKQQWQKFLTLWNKVNFLKKAYIIIAGVVGVALIFLFARLYLEVFWIEWDNIGKEDGKIRNLAIAFVGTITGIGALFGVFLAILRSEENKRQNDVAQQQADIAEQGMVTDRLNKATENLGKSESGEPVIEVRLGSLYALERIAQDSIRDHAQIMEILCAYIRNNSPRTDKVDKPEPIREDIQTALTIIGRHESWTRGKKQIQNEQKQKFRIDLRNCDLHGIILENANLISANLSQTNLSGATFFNSNLNSVNLKNADMNRMSFMAVKLNNANLKDASLISADLFVVELNNANISNANMRDITANGAKFNNANLYDASLSGAYILHSEFKGADFRGVETEEIFINGCDFLDCKYLTQEQLDVMCCGYDLKMPSGLEQPEHWPTDEEAYLDSHYTYHEQKNKK